MERKMLLMATVVLAVISMIYASSAFANCGPGPVVVQKSKGTLRQSLGASTNATFLPTQTFAITSGTSGCSNSGILRREVEQRFFVALHMDNIAQELAQGQGRYVDGLASLLGCGSEVYGEFGRMAQANYTSLFSAAEMKPRELLAAVKEQMRRHPLLSRNCDRIS
ncbi:MAG: DUF3015 family protein [SAR324 cluster bacterium]|nr:DUF3015 family protein [SAR324 cluster bacterium]